MTNSITQYACFVEDCDRKCSTPNKRRMHLIDKHMFPKDYDFYIVNDGIDQRSSMLRSGGHRRRSSAAQHKTDIDDRARRRSSLLGNIKSDGGENVKSEKPDTNDDVEKINNQGRILSELESNQSDSGMNGLIEGMSSLKFIPPSVRFGRGQGRGGFSKS
jgi:hypothetical protein